MTKETKDIIVQFRVDREMKAWIDNRAVLHGESISVLIRDIIRSFIEQKQK